MSQKEQNPNGFRAGIHENDFLVKTEKIRSETISMDPHTPFFFFFCAWNLDTEMKYAITKGITEPQSCNLTCLGSGLAIYLHALL